MNKVTKRIISIVLAVLILGGCGFGGVYAWQHRAKKEVKVYEIGDNFAMTDYWGDTSETEGMVAVEGMQSIYLSDTQTVKAIMVEEGQQVKKGDVLLTYDTTLTELDVKKKDITVQQLELQLENAQKELARVKSYRPNQYVPGTVTTFVIPGIPAPVEEPFEDDGTLILLGGTGTAADPFTYAWDESYAFDEAFFYQCMRGERDCYVKFVISGSGEVPEHVHVADENGWYHDEDGHWHVCAICGEKFDEAAHDFWRVTDKLPDIDVKGHWYEQCTVCGEKGEEGNIDAIKAPEPEKPNDDKKDDEQQNDTKQDDNKQEDTEQDDTKQEDTKQEDTKQEDTKQEDTKQEDTKQEDTKQEDTKQEDTKQEDTKQEDTKQDDAEAEGDAPSGGQTSSPTPARTETPQLQGYLLFQLQHSDAGYQIQLISIDVPSTDVWATLPIFQWAEGSPLPELPEPEPVEDIPAQRITDGVKYTSEELNAMVQEAEANVRDLDIRLRQAKLEYEKAEQELNNGAIYSDLDGKVTNLVSEDEANAQGAALMRVTAGGGYYIQGTLSELELGSVQVGQTVSLSSWMSGTECEGTIVEISDYPSTNGYNWGDGNSNVSYYPFTVFVPEDAGLQEGEYVEIEYSPAESEAGFYLQSVFIRSENGRSYVYVQGEDGTLEKRYISTGRSLWGSYTQIRGGISVNDCLAFPYGNDVVEGAPTALSTAQEFYGW